MLTANEILNEMNKGNILIEPYNAEYVNPNSIDLTLNEKLLVYKNDLIDAKQNNETEVIIIPPEGYILNPGELYLGSTNEYTVTKKHIPCIEGKSSIARLGITTHQTCGFGDIGFSGKFTLEIAVIKPVRIYANMKICQIYYSEPTGEITMTYNGKYQNQTDVIASRSYKDFI